MADPVDDVKRDERELRALLGQAPLEENQPLLGTAPLPDLPVEETSATPPGVSLVEQGEFGRGLQQSFAQDELTRVGLQIERAALEGNQEEVDRLRPLFEYQQRRTSRVGPSIQSLQNVDDVSDFIDFAFGIAGSQGPQLAKTAAGGLAGGVVGGAVGGPVGATVGAGLGAGAVSVGLETAEGAPEAAFAEDSRFTLQERAQLALVSGVFRGSLDAFPVLRLLRRMPRLKKLDINKEITDRVDPSRIMSAAKQGLAEGGTEIIQESIGMATQRFIEDNWHQLTEEEIWQLADAFTAGAMLGGGLGAFVRERPSGALSDSEKKLLQRLDAHLSGEKSLEDQVQEEADGKNSMSGTEASDVDPVVTERNRGEQAEQDARAELQEEADVADQAAREELSADIEKFKAAAKAKGKDAANMTKRAMRFVRNVARRKTRKVRNITKKGLERMRTAVDETDSRLEERFDPENATDQSWAKFAKNAVQRLRERFATTDGSVESAIGGDANTTEVRKAIAALDRIRLLSDRLSSDQFTDEQKALLRTRLKAAVNEAKNSKPVARVIQTINNKPRRVVHPEVQQYVRDAITQGRPAEVLMEVFGLSEGELDSIMTVEERPFLRSRSEMDADEVLEHDNDVRAEIQALGIEEIAPIQEAFDNLSEADFDALLSPETQAAVEEDTEMQASAREMEQAANVMGFQVEEEPTGPQPHVMPNGRLKVGLQSRASKNPNKPSAMEKMVDTFNATDGPRAGLVWRLKKFSEFIEEAVVKAPNDRSAAETQVVGNERIMTKGLEDRIRKAYYVKPDKTFGDYWVIIEEQSDPDVTMPVPYLLTTAEVQDSHAKRTDTKDLPVDPHNAVQVDEVKINLPRLTKYARQALVNRSPTFWAGTLDTAERTAVEGQFKQRTHLEQAVIAYYHGIADLIIRGVIDTWPHLSNDQVIYSTQVGGKAVKVTWGMVKNLSITNQYRNVAKGMTKYLVRRAETQISRHKSTLQRVSDLDAAIKNSSDPVLVKERRKWEKAEKKARDFFRTAKIDPSKVQLNPLTGEVENLNGFMPFIRQATTLGLADQFRQEQPRIEQAYREEIKKLKAEKKNTTDKHRLEQIQEKIDGMQRFLKASFDEQLAMYYEQTAADRNGADFAGKVGMSGAIDIAGHAAKIRGLAKRAEERELSTKDRKKRTQMQDRLHTLEQKPTLTPKEKAEIKRLRKKVATFYGPSEKRRITRFQGIYKIKTEIDLLLEGTDSQIFFDKIDDLRRAMDLPVPDRKYTGYVKETLAAARQEIDDFRFAYIARDQQTDLQEIIGNIDLDVANNIRDIKDTPDVTHTGAMFDAPEEISALIARDQLVTPTAARGALRKRIDPKGEGAEGFGKARLSDAALGKLPPLMTPVEQFHWTQHSIEEFLSKMNLPGSTKLEGEVLEQLREIWDRAFGGGFDQKAALAQFAKEWTKTENVRVESALQAIELELFRMARVSPLNKDGIPTIDTFSELEKVLPNNPKVRALKSERQRVLKKAKKGRNADELASLSEAEILSPHFTVYGVRQDATLEERTNAARRQFSPKLNIPVGKGEITAPTPFFTEVEAKKRYMAWAEWVNSEKAPRLALPTGTRRNVLIPKDEAQTAVNLVNEALGRVTESVQETDVTTMLDDQLHTDRTLKIETVADLLTYLDSLRATMMLKSAAHQQGLSGASRESYARQTTEDALPSSVNEDVTTRGATAGRDTWEIVRSLIDTMGFAIFEGPSSQRDLGRSGIQGLYHPGTNVIKLLETLNKTWAVGTAGHEAMHALWFQTLHPSERNILSKAFGSDAAVKKILDYYKNHLGLSERELSAVERAMDPRSNVNYMTERVSYAFGAYTIARIRTDKPAFVIPKQPATVFDKVWQIIKQLIRYTTPAEQAQNLFELAISGEIKQAKIQGRKVDLRNKQGIAPTQAVDAIWNAWRATQHLVRGFLIPFDSGLRATKIPALVQLSDLVFVGPLHRHAGSPSRTFLNDYTREQIKWTNVFQRKWETLSPQRAAKVRDALYSSTPLEELDAQTQSDVKWFRSFFNSMRKYVTETGADLGDIPNFVPIRWDAQRVADNEALLRAMLEDVPTAELVKATAAQRGTKEQAINEIVEHLKRNPDVMGEDRFAANFDTKEISQRRRHYSFLIGKDLSPFMVQDFDSVMMGYIQQMTRYAESTRHFGVDGQRVKDLLVQAREQGATPKELEDAHNYILAARGQLGANISESLSKTLAWIATYQHLRVLAFATFASFVEVVGIATRSQSLNATWEALKVAWDQVLNLYTNFPRRREIKKRLKELRNKTTLRPEEDVEFEALTKELQDLETQHDRFAREMGTLDGAIMYDQLIAASGTMPMDSLPKKINEWFFKWNGLQAWTSLTRKMATRAAYIFIKENALHPRKHSKRFLADLGLTYRENPITSDLVFDENGELLTSFEAIDARYAEIGGFVSEERRQSAARATADRLERAIWQFVDESVLRPNAANRPLRASDPHWQLLFHMKHYIFAVQHQILNRIFKEAYKHGNYVPVAALAAYPGVMLMGDFMRSTIQYGLADEDDEWKNPYNRYSFGELLMRSTRRSGVLGILEPYTGFGENVNRFGGTGFEVLTGPSVQQGLELSRTLLTGSPSAYKAMHNALPLSNVYRNWGNPFN